MGKSNRVQHWERRKRAQGAGIRSSFIFGNQKEFASTVQLLKVVRGIVHFSSLL